MYKIGLPGSASRNTEHVCLWRTVWRFLKKTENRATIYLCNPTPDGRISGETHIPKEYMHTDVHSALFKIAKTGKQSKCPSVEGWIKKMWYVYNGILLNHLKE